LHFVFYKSAKIAPLFATETFSIAFILHATAAGALMSATATVAVATETVSVAETLLL